MYLIFKKSKDKKITIGSPITRIIYRDKSTGVEFQQTIRKENLTSDEIKRDMREKRNLLGSGIEIKEIEKGITVF